MKGGYCVMKLLSLTANKPNFHSIVFKEGINIIVGKQVSPHDENDGNTYNGVGKSLTVHLIHFCLGANKIDSFSANCFFGNIIRFLSNLFWFFKNIAT